MIGFGVDGGTGIKDSRAARILGNSGWRGLSPPSSVGE